MALSQRYLSWFWAGICWPVTETSLELCVLLPSMLIGSTLSLVLPSLAAGLSGSSAPYDHFGSLSLNQPHLIQVISVPGLTPQSLFLSESSNVSLPQGGAQ